MSRRFFVDQPIHGSSTAIEGAEAQHLTRVMRASEGDEITLFDGSGAEFTAVIANIKKKQVELEITARHEISRELPRPLVAGAALPKGDRQRVLIEKLVELGATQLTPLTTTRGVAQPTSKALARLTRTVIEASKQCGRNTLMQITPPATVAEFVTQAPPGATRWLAHPGGGPLQAPPDATAVWCLTGPEGGFTDEECDEAIAAGWTNVSLGQRILRAETAIIAMCAVAGLTTANGQ